MDPLHLNCQKQGIDCLFMLDVLRYSWITARDRALVFRYSKTPACSPFFFYQSSGKEYQAWQQEDILCSRK